MQKSGIFVWLSPMLLIPLGLAVVSGDAAAATVESGIAPGICLETPDGIPAAGKQLQVNTCNGTDAQRFAFSDAGEIRFGAFCVDVWGGMGRNGDAVILWYCHGGLNQKWTRTAAVEIRGINARCIDLSGVGAGSKAMLWDCRGSASQKWAVVEDPCTVKNFQPSPHGGLTVWSPDGSQYLVNKEDSNGIAQIYVGQKGTSTPVCITCTDQLNGPKASKFKMQPKWHPSGKWIVLAVEQENFVKPFLAWPDLIEGWLQSGIWVDMYATTPDGSAWFKLQDFGPSVKADGFTGVEFTPDGKKGVWAQIVDGNILAYTFGKWELILADFQDINGVPSFTNARDITPPDTFWVEPGNFSPNGKDLLLTADHGFPDHSKVEGMDQYILDIDTGEMTNLTKTPNIWDEHGYFSPDGEKILFMSSYPFRSDPKASTTFFLKTEFMIMNKDGSNLRQVSRFNTPGYSEYTSAGVAANGAWTADGRTVSALSLFFPNYRAWEIVFEGNCGRVAK